MVKRTKKIALGIAALAALAFGGSALAQAGNTTAKPTPAPAVATQDREAPGSKDTDSVQSGDQSAPDSKGSSEQPDSSEKPESASENGSEVPGDDGPLGHADEPGDPKADHQAEGKE